MYKPDKYWKKNAEYLIRLFRHDCIIDQAVFRAAFFSFKFGLQNINKSF